MKSLIASVLIAACAISAQAQEQEQEERSGWLPSTIGLSIGSKHSVQGFNESNLGLSLGWPSGWVAGYFENSHSRGNNAYGDARRYSYFAAHRFSTDTLPLLAGVGISAALDLGAVGGYMKCNASALPVSCKKIISPYALPSAALHYKDVALRIGAVPNTGKSAACKNSTSAAKGQKAKAICALTFSLEYSF